MVSTVGRLRGGPPNSAASRRSSSHSGPSGHVILAASARCKYSCAVPRPSEQLRAICRSPRPTSNFNRRTSLILRTDNLLAGKLILPFGGGGCLPLCCPAPLSACGNHSGEAERSYGIGLKLFGFIPEPVFTFIPESCSESSRNTVRNHPGIAFALPRIPQNETKLQAAGHTGLPKDFQRSSMEWM